MSKFWLIAAVTWMTTAAFPQALPCQKPGVERWSVKTSLPAHPQKVKMSLVSALSDAHLPPLSDVKKNDHRYKDARITTGPVQEDQLVTTVGWLYLVAFEADDCDFHLQLSPTPHTLSDPPTKADNSLIVELPAGQYAADSALGDKFESMRSWIVKRLLAGKPPKIGSVHVMMHPVYVRVTGALFYDDAHVYSADHTTGRGKKKLPSKTLWELHPITAIAFAPKPHVH